MISARVAKRIWDAKDHGEAILQFTAGMDEASFSANALVRAAVERQFEIIGEALNVVRRDDPDAAADVPQLAQWVGYRNFLAHRYDEIRDDMTFHIIQIDLPPLLAALSLLLDRAEPP